MAGFKVGLAGDPGEALLSKVTAAEGLGSVRHFGHKRKVWPVLVCSRFQALVISIAVRYITSRVSRVERRVVVVFLMMQHI